MKLKAILLMRGVSRTFEVGEQRLTALKNINLAIHAGTMVAIMGASGSGKSTLLNILGCLDQPSEGSYRVWGRESRFVPSDTLAGLRRKYFGFIFQRYHLLSSLTALENVEVPAVYARSSPEKRRYRGERLLMRLGLADRLHHRPHQLSGGQQQRVSVARALMNGAQVIFADEPTGALDEESGRKLMGLLVALHRAGHTVVIATHDAKVAACAERIIDMRDGAIVADRANPGPAGPAEVLPMELPAGRVSRKRASKHQILRGAFKMAGIALLRHRFRTALTLLGIVIGIASLVSIIALGEGGQRRMRETLGTLTDNTIEVYRGTGWEDIRAPAIHTLSPADMLALQDLPYITSVTPMTKESMVARHEEMDSKATITGVSDSFFKTRSIVVAEGRSFSADEIKKQAQVVVIDQATKAVLFSPDKSPLGETIIIGVVPFTVIGITSGRSQDFYVDRGLNLLVPYSTAGIKLFGRLDFDSLSIRVRDTEISTVAEKHINAVLLRMHGEKDFFTNNMDAMAQAYASTTRSIALMLSVIAAISLLVGGIGVMNIMLVSVTERTREIGVRMAVGARRSDIMKQFLVEAVVVCLIGALMGIGLSLAIGALFSFLVQEWKMVFTPGALLSALLFSMVTGVIFGYLPAHKASRLNPVDALARD